MITTNTAHDPAAGASSLLRRAKALVALGTIGAALAAAAPASAMPIDGNVSESGCTLGTRLGSLYYAHGSTVTVTGRDGVDRKYRCNNGTWEEVKTAETAPTETFGATSGTYDGRTPATTTTHAGPSGTAASNNP